MATWRRCSSEVGFSLSQFRVPGRFRKPEGCGVPILRGLLEGDIELLDGELHRRQHRLYPLVPGRSIVSIHLSITIVRGLRGAETIRHGYGYADPGFQRLRAGITPAAPAGRSSC